MLAALACVDYVVVFDDTSVAGLVERFLPDVLVKAAQYSVEQVVGHQIVARYGGRVVTAAMKPQYSTTMLIEVRGIPGENVARRRHARRGHAQTQTRTSADESRNLPPQLARRSGHGDPDVAGDAATIRAAAPARGHPSPQSRRTVDRRRLARRAVVFRPRAKRPDQRRFALVRRMRQERFDLVLLLTNSFHTALLAWLGGAKERVGYARNGRGLLLTSKTRPPRDGKEILPRPMVQSYLDLAAAVGCGPESPRLELAVTPPEHRLGESIWRRLGLRRDGRVVAIYSGGAYGSAKQWPVEHAAALARLIVAETRPRRVDPLRSAGMPDRPRHRPPGRVSPRVFPGEPAGGPAGDEGLPRSGVACWSRRTAGRGTSPPPWARR